MGFGDNFWQIKSINDKLDMKKNINEDAFDNKSFNKGAYNFIAKNNKIHQGNIWNSYVLSETLQTIKNKQKR